MTVQPVILQSRHLTYIMSKGWLCYFGIVSSFCSVLFEWVEVVLRAVPEFSVVVPVRNESGNISLLVEEIQQACNQLQCEYEIVIVDDGSTDETVDIVIGLKSNTSNLRLLRHEKNGGQSAAIHSGVLHAKGRIICTIDGDGQNPPEEIPRIVQPLIVPGVLAELGLVAGQRLGRRDTFSKLIASRIANRVRSFILSDGTRDTGCGLKAFPRSVFLELPYFNHMHRYLPALVARAGYRIQHVDVSHRQRAAGKSNYSNFQRIIVGIPDLLGVYWLTRRAKSVRVHESHS